MAFHPPDSRRLKFQPLTIEAIEALMIGDREGVEAATGATFAEPLTAPPEMDHALPAIRDTLRNDPASCFWGPFLIVFARDPGSCWGGRVSFPVKSRRTA